MMADEQLRLRVRDALIAHYGAGNSSLAAFDAAMAELDMLRAKICVTVDAAGVLLRARHALRHCADKHGAAAAHHALVEVEHFTSKHGMAAKADAGSMSDEVIDKRIEAFFKRGEHGFIRGPLESGFEEGFLRVTDADGRVRIYVDCADIVRAALAEAPK